MARNDSIASSTVDAREDRAAPATARSSGDSALAETAALVVADWLALGREAKRGSASLDQTADYVNRCCAAIRDADRDRLSAATSIGS
jgi:hypothetical protein